MNTNFQEMDEGPMFDDVSVYNRTVTTAEQIPMSSTAFVKLTVKAAWQWSFCPKTDPKEIDYVPSKTPKEVMNNYSQTISKGYPDSLKMTKEAASTDLCWLGGLLVPGCWRFSEQFNIPVMNTVPSTGVISTDHRTLLALFGRLEQISLKPCSMLIWSSWLRISVCELLAKELKDHSSKHEPTAMGRRLTLIIQWLRMLRAI